MDNATDTLAAEAPANSRQQIGMRRTVELGAMSPPLTKQLRGLNVPKARLRILDKLAESLTWCYVHGLLTEPERQRAGQRLIALVGKEVKKANVKDQATARRGGL
jgi:hypothetical protein